MATKSETGRSDGDFVTRAAAKAAMCYMCAKPDRYRPAEAIEGSERLFHFQGSDNWNVGQCQAQLLNSVKAATPADAEQLGRLREVAERTLTMMNQYKERHLVPAYFSEAVADLRDTLADPSGEKSKKTVQCADCLAWIDKDANHTCRQQVQRNRKVRT